MEVSGKAMGRLTKFHTMSVRAGNEGLGAPPPGTKLPALVKNLNPIIELAARSGVYRPQFREYSYRAACMFLYYYGKRERGRGLRAHQAVEGIKWNCYKHEGKETPHFDPMLFIAARASLNPGAPGIDALPLIAQMWNHNSDEVHHAEIMELILHPAAVQSLQRDENPWGMPQLPVFMVPGPMPDMVLPETPALLQDALLIMPETHGHHHHHHAHHTQTDPFSEIFFRSFMRGIPGLDPYAVCVASYQAAQIRLEALAHGGHHHHHAHHGRTAHAVPPGISEQPAAPAQMDSRSAAEEQIAPELQSPIMPLIMRPGIPEKKSAPVEARADEKSSGNANGGKNESHFGGNEIRTAHNHVENAPASRAPETMPVGEQPTTPSNIPSAAVPQELDGTTLHHVLAQDHGRGKRLFYPIIIGADATPPNEF